MEEIKTTYVQMLEDEHTSPMEILYEPLPIIRPKVSIQWKGETWNHHTVYGNSEFHVFAPNEGTWSLILAVSSEKDCNGGWFYEDLNYFSSPALLSVSRRMADRRRSLIRSIEQKEAECC